MSRYAAEGLVSFLDPLTIPEARSPPRAAAASPGVLPKGGGRYGEHGGGPPSAAATNRSERGSGGECLAACVPPGLSPSPPLAVALATSPAAPLAVPSTAAVRVSSDAVARQLGACIDPPPCCTHYQHVGGHYALYQRLANATYRFIGQGHCLHGYYAGWGDDDEWWSRRLVRCLGKCTAEPQCRYVAFVPGKSCSRYNQRAGACEGSPEGR